MSFISKKIQAVLNNQDRVKNAGMVQDYVQTNIKGGGTVVYAGAGTDVANPVAFTGMNSYIFFGYPQETILAEADKVIRNTEAPPGYYWYLVKCKDAMKEFHKDLNAAGVVPFPGSIGQQGPSAIIHNTPAPHAHGPYDACFVTEYICLTHLKSDDGEDIDEGLTLRYVFASYADVVNKRIIEAVLESAGEQVKVLFSKRSWDERFGQRLFPLLSIGGLHITDTKLDTLVYDTYRFVDVSAKVFGDGAYMAGLLGRFEVAAGLAELGRIYVYEKQARH